MRALGALACLAVMSTPTRPESGGIAGDSGLPRPPQRRLPFHPAASSRGLTAACTANDLRALGPQRRAADLNVSRHTQRFQSPIVKDRIPVAMRKVQ